MELYKQGKPISHISKELNISHSLFSKYLKDNGVAIRKSPYRYKINQDIFETIDTEEKAYWLGFLYADGCVSSGDRNDIELSLQKQDISHLGKFVKFLGWDGIPKKDSYRCRVGFKNAKIKKDLIKLGCVPKKSLILKFPTEQQVPKHLQKHFVRGYFDGDGCICLTDKTKSINILGTYDMLINISDILNIDKNRIYKMNKNSTKIFRIVCEGKASIENSLNLMYKNSNIYLDRKYEKYLKLIN